MTDALGGLFMKKVYLRVILTTKVQKKGWCLYQLGCKGPFTYNACAITKWNDGVSFPMEAGHGCLGCSQPHFWDNNSFYRPLS